MQKNRDMIYIALFLAFVLIFWTGLSLLPGPMTVQLPASGQGGYDLTARDFEDTVYTTAAVWDSWPENLYMPAELAHAPAPVSQTSLDYTMVQYVTHRLRLKLPSGVDYGIIMESPDYAMRVYINGVEAGNVGIPGTTREETTPQETGLIAYFTAHDDITEIVVQTSNFVHRTGADAPPLTIGTAEAISQVDTVTKLVSGLMFGCLITAGLYHLATIILNRRQTATLVFGISCLLHAFVSVNFVGLMFPDINWQIRVRMEYILFIISVSMLIILIDILFPGALHRGAFRGYLVICSLYIILILASDTTIFTSVIQLFQALSIGMAAYVLVRLAIQLRQKTTKAVLAFIGVAVMVLFSVNEVLRLNGLHIFGLFPGEVMGVREGMVLFIFCYAILLSIEQSEVNTRLDEAGKALTQAELHYQELSEATHNGKSVAPDKLSLLKLTKRETDVALLLLDGKTRDELAGLLYISMGTVNYHCSNIYRKAEVNSLSELTALLRAQPDITVK